MEAGHLAQNGDLQAVSLQLSTVAVGAIDDKGVRHLLNLDGQEEPFSLMPVGRVR